MLLLMQWKKKNYKAEQTVIEQGENGDVLYVVEKGELACFKKISEESEPKFLKNYGPGDAFGELALLYNAPRAATVKAKADSQLWALDRETFNHIVKDASSKRRAQYESFLKSVEILSTMDDYEIGQICDALRVASYNAGDVIIREGEMGDVFYVIEAGEAYATKTMEPGKPPVQVKDYKKGEYFGELALIKGDPRAANVIAKTNLKLVSLDRNSFKRLLGPLDTILMRNSDKYVKYVKK